MKAVQYAGRQSPAWDYLWRQRWILSWTVQRSVAMEQRLTRPFERPPSSLDASLNNDAEPEQRGQRLKFKSQRRKTVFIINSKCVFSRRAHGNGPETSKGRQGMESQADPMVHLPTTTRGAGSQQQPPWTAEPLAPLIGCFLLLRSDLFTRLIGVSKNGGLQGQAGYNRRKSGITSLSA